jgi:hypothetical protein
VWSSNKDAIVGVCTAIGKSPISIYYNKKFQCWTIRIKSKKHKEQFTLLFGDAVDISPDVGDDLALLEC